jgi:hypothetical protein
MACVSILTHALPFVALERINCLPHFKFFEILLSETLLVV